MTPVTPPLQVEGSWEEVLRLADQFTGRRVRVTVLEEAASQAVSLRQSARQWMAEADSLVPVPPAAKPDPFGDGLVEKYRKQGLRL